MNKKHYLIARLLVIIVLIVIVLWYVTFVLSNMENTPYDSFGNTVSYLADCVFFYLTYMMIACLPLSIVAAVMLKHSGSASTRGTKLFETLTQIEISINGMWLLYMIICLIFHD